MRPASTDPYIRRNDPKDELIACPECHAWMLPLRDYHVPKTEAPSVECEPWEFLVWGWMAFVYNYVYDLATLEARKRKLATARQETLPKFPNTLVCPRCIHIVRKP